MKGGVGGAFPSRRNLHFFLRQASGNESSRKCVLLCLQWTEMSHVTGLSLKGEGLPMKVFSFLRQGNRKVRRVWSSSALTFHFDPGHVSFGSLEVWRPFVWIKQQTQDQKPEMPRTTERKRDENGCSDTFQPTLYPKRAPKPPNYELFVISIEGRLRGEMESCLDDFSYLRNRWLDICYLAKAS